MKKTTSVLSALLCILLCVTLLAGCNTNSDIPTNTDSKDNTESTAISAPSESLESKADMENAVQIDLDKGEVPASGVTLADSVYTIKKGGTYIISGTLESGQIIVNADKQDVWLILDNAHITCSDNSPLYIEDAKDTYLVLRKGSENSLTDGSTYSSPADSDPDATLFCKNDLYIGGEGSLTIDSNYNNALHTKDTLTIHEGNITIDSTDTGIKAKDGLTIHNGTINVTCAGDGLQTTNSEEADKGNIQILGGNITVASQKDAIQSENAMTISGGVFDLKTGGGAENADYKYDNPMGFWGGYTDTSSDVSMKALKAQGALTVKGGNFTINSEDDAIHSNTDVSVSGGNFSIATGDDGIHADSITEISGGEITITQSYEGIEGSEVNIKGGTIHLSASDDGVNSAGGGDTGYGGFGPDSFGNSASYMLNISGGYLYVNAGGDGLDSNGSISVTGGTTIVNGPENNGNSPFDWERECTINGGTFIAAGSAGMMETISSASQQYSIGINFGNTYASNTLCHITDGSGFALSFAPAKSFSYFFISSPDLEKGTDYSIYTGGSHTGNNTDGLYAQGDYTSGELLTTLTLSNTNETYGSFFGGMGGPGGGMSGPGGGMGNPGGGMGHGGHGW